MASRRDRPFSFGGPLPLRTDSILNLCELYDASIEDFEKILAIDDIIFPKLIVKKDDEGDAKKPKINQIQHPKISTITRRRPRSPARKR